MKKAAIAGIAAAVLFCWGMHAFASDASGVYRNKEKGFSMSFPNTWEKREGAMGTIIAVLSPLEKPTDQFRPNVNVVIEDLPRSNITVEEYMQAGLSQLRTMMTDFKEYEKGRAALGKADARWMVYSHRMGTLNLKVLVYMVVRGSQAYVISCTALPEQFPRFRAKFDAIAQTFAFE